MTPSADRTSELRILHAAILAAIGTSACSGGGGSARTEIELPPQPSASQRVSSTPPDRPNHQAGYVKEPNGSIHRASPVSCDTRIDLPACRGDEGRTMCKQDADCKDGPNGKCISARGQIGTYCGCQYACGSDADCKAEEACVCGPEANEKHSTCAPAACKSDADCGGRFCGVSRHESGCGNEVRLACRTADDKCRADADCGKDGRPGGQCAVGLGRNATAWSCQQMTCMIGRPFVVEGVARMAPLAAYRPDADRGAWIDEEVTRSLAPGAARLRPRERDVIARRTIEQARLEHASVASFARASLELLALGAPPDLLHDTTRAMRDEIEHARLCFAVARAYGATDGGPGPLDVTGAMSSAIDAASVAYAVAYEGCVGETLGAAVGTEDARDAADPALAVVLARIADDERRHATLAWRTLSWIVATFGDEARDAARRGIDDALRALTGDGATSLRRDAARLVVAPCAASLLG